MIINTNISSANTQNVLRQNNAAMAKVLARLSSGKRINSASDDAAGLGISERMSSMVTGNTAASRNIDDGKSLLQVGESALGSVSSLLQRMRELSVQADNGTYSSVDKTSLNNEFDQLSTEIDHIASNTSFNGVTLLNGGLAGGLQLHISYLSTDTMSISLATMNAAALSVGTSTTDLSTSAGAQFAISTIDAALNTVSAKRSDIGSVLNRLDFTTDALAASNTQTLAAKSRIVDADMAMEASNMSKYRILQQSSISMLQQANQSNQSVLSLLQG
jgi:flagellin